MINVLVVVVVVVDVDVVVVVVAAAAVAVECSFSLSRSFLSKALCRSEGKKFVPYKPARVQVQVRSR